MGTRGRPSTASLAVVPNLKNFSLVDRPAPPDVLSPEEAKEWRSIAGALPADWFGRETHQLLVQYVRNTVRSNELAAIRQQVYDSEKFDCELYEKLVRLEVQVSMVLTTLATKMRISQQSTYDKSKKKPSQAKQALWDKNY